MDKKIRVSHEHFQQFVDSIHFGDEAYDWSPQPNIGGRENEKPLKEYDGWLYVTTGDDIPCLVIYGPDNFGIVLKPALALYWLDKIREFYETHSSNQKVN